MSYKIFLPQLAVTLHKDREITTKILLITGGRTPDTAWLKRTANQRIIYCADHGLDICIDAGLIPDYILGDGDSVDSLNWQWAESIGIPVDKYPSAKNFTDTQLALEQINQKYPQSDIIITGMFGGRFDHLYSSIFSAAAVLTESNVICAADDKEILIYLKAESAVLKCEKIPESISLLPLEEKCHDVSINNVKWPLDKVILKQKTPYAISNVLKNDNKIKVKTGRGILGVYFYWPNN